ncbi:MAG: DUF2911 domain-containing protein [Weeksellaceae bacterium]|nr:DUF2911 domain-containing protein [Weeksellaceae bacterium]
MKKIVLSLFSVALFTLADAQVKTPQPSMSADVEQVVGMTKIEVEYARPSKNGRNIFGELVPYGKIWRTGANKNTTIEFEDDVIIEGQVLKAGKYAIYTVPEVSSWGIYFYADTENWGNPREWNDSKVMAKASAKVEKLPYVVESFTISLDDLNLDSVTLNFAWDSVKVGIKIEVPTDRKVEESIVKTMKGKPTAQDYMAAANYYYAAGKDIKQAKEWMDLGMKLNDKPAFYQIYQQALIHAKAGDKKSAIQLAEKSMEASKAAGSEDYMNLCEKLIKELSE